MPPIDSHDSAPPETDGPAPDLQAELAAALRERDALRRALAESEQRHLRDADAISAREHFIAMIAHELRSPVQALLLQLNATLLLSSSQAREPSWFRDRTAKVVERVRSLAQLIDKFLDVTRIHEGRIDLVTEEMDLVETVREMMSADAEELRWAGCAVALHAPERILGAWDRMRVQAIVSNLLGNARKYGAGQPIKVTLDADDREATLMVRDHGPGIPPAEQARIFEPFERLVTSASAPRISGMGLGLWIVRQFVEAHGGTIGVENREPSGAEFRVVLPLRT